MKRACKIGLEILLSGSVALGFLNTNSESFADEHTMYIDSERRSASDFISKKAQSARIAETGIAIDINQGLECDFKVAGLWDRKKSCYAPLDDIYGIYLAVRNPGAKIVYVVKLGGLSKPDRKEKYDMFHDNGFAAFANSKLLSRNEDEISWELSPAEGGRLVFGRSIRSGEEKNIENKWVFNVVGPGSEYSSIGEKNEPTPSDYDIKDRIGTYVNIYGLNLGGDLF